MTPSEFKPIAIGAAILVSVILVGGSIAKFSMSERLTEDPATEKSQTDLYAALSLEAKAAAVYDIKNGTLLFGKDAEAQLPLASLGKIMTAYLAGKTLPLDSLVLIDTNSVRVEGDSGLKSGEHWRLGDLLQLMLVESSNDGAAAVAKAFDGRDIEPTASKETFVEDMNREAQKLDLTQTFFVNEHGLDYASTTAGGYGSARDLAMLLGKAALQLPEIFDATAYSEITVFSAEKRAVRGKTTNKSIGGIPGLVASKTGFTDLAQGNLVLVFEAGPGRPIAVALLGSGLEARFSDAEQLVWATLASLSSLPLR